MRCNTCDDCIFHGTEEVKIFKERYKRENIYEEQQIDFCFIEPVKVRRLRTSLPCKQAKGDAVLKLKKVLSRKK